MACFNGYINGDAATQTEYLAYAGLRQSFTSAGIATTKQTTLYSYLAASTCNADACSSYDSTSYDTSLAAGLTDE